MFNKFKKGKKENPEHISIEQYNQELEEAEVEFSRGEYITHEELLDEVKKMVDKNQLS